MSCVVNQRGLDFYIGYPGIVGWEGGRARLERWVTVIDKITSPATARSARLRNTQLGLTVIK